MLAQRHPTMADWMSTTVPSFFTLLALLCTVFLFSITRWNFLFVLFVLVGASVVQKSTKKQRVWVVDYFICFLYFPPVFDVNFCLFFLHFLICFPFLQKYWYTHIHTFFHMYVYMFIWWWRWWKFIVHFPSFTALPIASQRLYRHEPYPVPNPANCFS